MVYAARKATGFEVQGHRWWVRVTEVPEQPAMPLVKPGDVGVIIEGKPKKLKKAKKPRVKKVKH